MDQPFDWYLQQVDIVHETERDAGGEMLHSLGGGGYPRGAYTPQIYESTGPTDSRPGLTNAPRGSSFREYLPTVEGLTYPDEMVGVASGGDCDIEVMTVGMPNPTWSGMFGGNPVATDLWAPWGQQVAEIRQRVTPVPVG